VAVAVVVVVIGIGGVVPSFVTAAMPRSPASDDVCDREISSQPTLSLLRWSCFLGSALLLPPPLPLLQRRRS
jgi:hypothetical protein